jgi:hypothetical protein
MPLALTTTSPPPRKVVMNEKGTTKFGSIGSTGEAEPGYGDTWDKSALTKGTLLVKGSSPNPGTHSMGGDFLTFTAKHCRSSIGTALQKAQSELAYTTPILSITMSQGAVWQLSINWE